MLVHLLLMSLFALLLIDHLTKATLIFVAVGVILSYYKVKLSPWPRNLIALGLFASYFTTYGKVIDPEVGLNFLTSIVLLKFFDKTSERDHFMVFFGLVLLLGAGILFERTLTYVLFTGLGLLALIRELFVSLGRWEKIRSATPWALLVIPFAFILFFTVPRLMNPLPFRSSAPGAGELGYTPDVNVSEVDSLSENNTPVFQVQVEKALPFHTLYWRGNTLVYNDGWNWRESSKDQSELEEAGGREIPHGIKQRFRLYSEAPYFFTLDYPGHIRHSGKDFFFGPLRTAPQRKLRWVQRYEVTSLTQRMTDTAVTENALKVPLSRREQERLRGQFPGKTIEEIEHKVREYFLKEKFSYSLAPGKTQTLGKFLEKKVGLCSHYSSFLGIILRLNGIPTRLVSGFLGGSFNRFGQFYVVTQNDSHVWVEAFQNGQWRRLDPTEWIAPDRIRLGGEAFVQNLAQNPLTGGLRAPDLFRDLGLWFGQWDFRFYQWLEQLDYYSQDSLLLSLNWKREWLYTLVPVTFVLFMLTYALLFTFFERRDEASVEALLWTKFHQKMEKAGLSLSRTHVLSHREMIEASELKNKDQVLEVWRELVELSFDGKDIPWRNLKRKIVKL
jgi:hypothetical protein